MSSYANQSNVESVLGRALSADEITGLPFLLDAVEAWINGEIHSEFGLADDEATRYFDADHSSMIDIDALYVDEDHPFTVKLVDADENPLRTIDSSDYEARPRNDNVKTYIQLRGGRKWASICSHSVANIAVSGFWGRGDDVPADIAYLAAYMAAQAIGSTKSLSLKSESIEGYSRTFATLQSEDSTVKRILSKYDEVLI